MGVLNSNLDYHHIRNTYVFTYILNMEYIYQGTNFYFCTNNSLRMNIKIQGNLNFKQQPRRIKFESLNKNKYENDTFQTTRLTFQRE